MKLSWYVVEDIMRVNKYVIAVILLLFALSMNGRSLTIVIEDASDSKPISYASVFLDKRRIGCAVDSNGLKVIDYKNLFSVDTQTMKCVAFGYEPCEIALDGTVLDQDTLLIKLEPSPVLLSELIVVPKNGKKRKRRIIGKKNNHGIFKCVYGDFDSINSIIDFTTGFEVKTKKGFSELSKFGFYIMNHERMLSRMKFRINVYDMSNVDSAPSNKFRMIIPPVIIDYKKDMVVDNKFVYEFPNPIFLPREAMVEIEFVDSMGDEFILTKGNALGKSVWSKINSEFWSRDPFRSKHILLI